MKLGLRGSMEKALEKSMSTEAKLPGSESLGSKPFRVNAINSRAALFDSFIIGYTILCLIVAVLNPSREQMLNLGQNSLVALASFAFGAALSVVLGWLGVKTLGGQLFEPPHLKGKGVVRTWYKTFWGLEFLIAFAITMVVSLQVTGFSFYELFSEQGFGGARRIFGEIATPNFAILPRGVLAIIETIYIAFLSTVIAIPVSFLLAFFSAKNIMSGSQFTLGVYFVLRTFLNISRSIEPLIWAIIFSVWVGIGPFAGMLALMIQSVASLTKQYSEIIECVDDGPIEGIQSTGANPVQVVWFAIVPQIVLPYISFTIYRWDINVRMATVIGLVGGGGIGNLLVQYQGQAMWHEVGTLAFLIIIVVWSMDTASAYIREALK